MQYLRHQTTFTEGRRLNLEIGLQEIAMNFTMLLLTTLSRNYYSSTLHWIVWLELYYEKLKGQMLHGFLIFLIT